MKDIILGIITEVLFSLFTLAIAFLISFALQIFLR